MSAQREAHRKAMASYRSKDPERHRRHKANYDLLQYHLSLEQYEQLEDKLGHSCSICCEVPHGGRGVTRRLVVDHCHDTGEVRGLLCANCNSGLGLLKDSPEVLRRAISYLESHGKT